MDTGVNKSGKYYIAPQNGVGVIEVFCDFDAMEYQSCEDYFEKGNNNSGTYNIYVLDSTITVYCDFETGNKYIINFPKFSLI